MATLIDVDDDVVDDVDYEVDDHVDGDADVDVHDDVDCAKSGGNISRQRLVATSCCYVWW